MIAPVTGYPISQHFGEHPEYYATLGYAGHHGLDYACPEGTPVRAAHDGHCSITLDDETAGTFIRIYAPNGFSTRYLHLSSVAVPNWSFVGAGNVIGRSGNTGLSDGPHLHFEVIDGAQTDNGYKGRVDPLPYITEEEKVTDEDKLVIAQALWDIKTYLEGPQTKARRQDTAAKLLEAVRKLKGEV